MDLDIESLRREHGERVVALRRFFHARPEPSRKERETSLAIQKELDEIGVPWRRLGTGEGVVGMIEGGKPGRTIMLRGDMDALEVEELDACPFMSRNPGIMHACGHDCHMAMLLVAARILQGIRDRLAGRVALCFQPAEEIGWGAPDMVAAGVLEGVDGVFGIHVWSDLPAGAVSVPVGPRMAGNGRFKIVVRGKGGHAAMPHQAVDAGLATAAVVQNLNTIVSREIEPVKTAVLSVGQFHCGTRWNVIPEQGTIEGTTRYFDVDVGTAFVERIRRVAEETAKAFRAQATLEYTRLASPVINHPDVAGCARRAADAILGEGCHRDGYGPTMVSEDFASYCERRPSAMALLGVANPACDSCWPQHSGHYKVDESALINGALLHVLTAVGFLEANA